MTSQEFYDASEELLQEVFAKQRDRIESAAAELLAAIDAVCEEYDARFTAELMPHFPEINGDNVGEIRQLMMASKLPNKLYDLRAGIRECYSSLYDAG